MLAQPYPFHGPSRPRLIRRHNYASLPPHPRVLPKTGKPRCIPPHTPTHPRFLAHIIHQTPTNETSKDANATYSEEPCSPPSSPQLWPSSRPSPTRRTPSTLLLAQHGPPIWSVHGPPSTSSPPPLLPLLPLTLIPFSTRSNKTLTGPGFYNPIKDELIEPSRTGISYSFTNDGWYEEAYYRAISNPAEPACPGGIMQWQHGRFYMDANGSLILQPIAVDGRQLLSEPCTYDNGIYTRYNQSELFLVCGPLPSLSFRLEGVRGGGADVLCLHSAMSSTPISTTTSRGWISTNSTAPL